MPTQFNLPSRFTALDGWRGICALLVAAYHFHTISHIEGLGIVRNAYLLVDFFFVLSGFIISYAYAGRLVSWAQAGTMIWRRIGRLWPLHVVVLALFVALELAALCASSFWGGMRSADGAFDPQSPALLSAIPSNLLLMHALGLHDRLTWNIPSWSISAEAWVYVVFAAGMVLAQRWSLVLAGALAMVGAGVVAVASTRGMAVDYELGFFRCLYGFFCGHIVYRLMAAAPRGLVCPTLVEGAAVVGIAGFVAWAGGTVAEFAAPFVFGAAIWIFAGERGLVSDFLKAPVMRKLGLYSYSIYMVHALVIAVLHRATTALELSAGVSLSRDIEYRGQFAKALSFGGPALMDVVVLVYLAAVVGMAALAWRYIEMPCQAWWNNRQPGARPLIGGPVTSQQAAE